MEQLNSFDISSVRNDLEKVIEVIPSISPESPVRKDLEAIVNKFNRMILDAEHRQSTQSGTGMRLKIKIVGKETAILTHISPQATLQSLKLSIQETIDRPLLFKFLVVSSTGKRFDAMDSTTIESCGIVNMDTLTIEEADTFTESQSSKPIQEQATKSMEVVEAPTEVGLHRIRNLNMQLNALQGVAVAAHCYMLDARFVTQCETANQVSGFAPSIRDLPRSQLLPPSWNKDPTTVTLLYKHASKPHKMFSLICLRLNGSDEVLLSLSEKGGQSFTSKISISHHIRSSNGTGNGSDNNTNDTVTVGDDLLLDATVFESTINAMITQILPQASTSGTPGVATGRENTQQSGNYNPKNSGTTSSTFIPDITGARPPPRVPSVGEGDLYPFGPGAYPAFHPSGGGGSLVGPDHPMFSGIRDNQPHAPDFPLGYPQPRFDPLGPVTGPMGPDFGDGDDRFRMPGRGRGRGRGGVSRIPGEPTPDHLKPPGW